METNDNPSAKAEAAPMRFLEDIPHENPRGDWTRSANPRTLPESGPGRTTLALTANREVDEIDVRTGS